MKMQQPQQQISHNDECKRQLQTLKEQEGRLRQLCLKENLRKGELEVAKSAEEKLLREARHQQDEFITPNSIPNRPNQPPMNHQMIPNSQPHIPNHQPIPNYNMEKVNHTDNCNHHDVPPPLPTSPPPMEPSFQSVYSQKPASMWNQRLNDSHLSQQNSSGGYEKQLEPHARKSSYEITNQMLSMGTAIAMFHRPCETVIMELPITLKMFTF